MAELGKKYFIINKDGSKYGHPKFIMFPFTLLRILNDGRYDLFKNGADWEERQFIHPNSKTLNECFTGNKFHDEK